MKNYDEMYRRVLQRRDEHLEKKRKNIIIMKRTFPAAAGFCFALILGISLNANKDPFHKPPAVVEEYISPTQPVTENNVTQPASPGTSLPPADISTSSDGSTTNASTTLSPALSGQPEHTPPVQSEPAPEINSEVTYTTPIQPQTTQPESAFSQTTRATTPKTTKKSEITKTKSTSKTLNKTTSAKTSVSVIRTTTSSTPGFQNHVSTSIVNIPGPDYDDPNHDNPPDPIVPTPPPIIDITQTIAYSGYNDLACRLFGESSDAVADQLGMVNQWSSEVFRDFLQKRSEEMTIMIPFYNDEPLELREEMPIILDPSGLFKEIWINYFFPDDNASEYVKITYLHGDEIDPETYPEYDHSYRTYITLSDRICYAAIGRNDRDPNVYVNFVYDDVLAIMCITENRFTSGFLENFSFRNLQLR